ncbi:MAG: hypothetical protein JXR84_09765, partial [Anaerolineae bacterium]|nr:hypothetical protein [Anaerolineae bacterium]
GETWIQLSPFGTPPAARDGHSAIYDAANARMIVFGGYSLNDVWALDLNTPGAETWTQLSPAGTLPAAREAHSAIYDAPNARMIVFGGKNISGGDLNDVWALDLSTPGAETWTQLSPLGTLPAARFSHSAIYDAPNARMIVFGGRGFNDVWVLDLSTSGAETWTQLSPSGTLPEAREGHSAIYDAANARMIVFGGGSNDLWSLDLSTPGSEAWIQHLPDADYRVGENVTLVAASPGFSTDQTLYLVGDDQLYRSTDAGVTWSPLPALPGIVDLEFSPAYASDHTLYAVAGGEIHRSTDSGATWTTLSAGLGANSVSVTADGQSWTLFAATSSGVWRYAFPQPENVRTLILTHQARLRARYGAEADALLQKLYTLAEHPAVEGLVVELGDADAFPEVAAAYAAWDASSPPGTLLLGDTVLANQVAQAVRDVVGTYVDAYPNIHYLVLVGHDEVIPFHRLPDGTAADALPYADYAPITGTVTLALAEGMTLSDDPYASLHPLTLPDGATLYVPDLSAGRLVESPDDINATIDALLRSEINEHALAFVSGADYVLLDSAYAIADTLQSGNLVPTALIGNG